MYKVKPLLETEPQIPIPSCMYQVKSIYSLKESHSGTGEDSCVGNVENYQLQVLDKLETLKQDVLEFKNKLNVEESASNISENVNFVIQDFKAPEICQDIVIKASPDQPPLSIWVFYNLLSQTIPMQLSTYTHSSLVDVPNIVHQLSRTKDNLKSTIVSFTIIWKNVGKDAEMMIDPVHQGAISGEVNIARYLARLFSFSYENDPFIATEIDYWLELTNSSIIHGNNKERNAALKSINSQLRKSPFLVGDLISLADIVLWSAIVQCSLYQSLPSNIDNWWRAISTVSMFKTPLL